MPFWIRVNECFDVVNECFDVVGVVRICCSIAIAMKILKVR